MLWVTAMATVLSAVAAASAAWAARSTQQMARTEAERVETERLAAKRSTISASLRSSGALWLRLVNEGPGRADGVAVEVTAALGGVLELVALPGTFPVALLPRQTLEMPVVVAVRHPRHVVVGLSVSWADGAGQHEHAVPLTVPFS